MSRLTSLLCAAALLALAPAAASAADGDWPSFNRTLTSERYAPLGEINLKTVKGLKVLCAYDTGGEASFQSGLLEVGGALYGTTGSDTFALDPDTCAQIWRVKEAIPPGFLKVNRGLAYLDGRLFRGFADGGVAAYDAKSGQRLWMTSIADPKAGESVPAAPIAWNGMVFVGNAGGDSKGVKGRMYALDAATGKVLWEAFLVPKGPADVSRGPSAPPPPAALGQSWTNDPAFPVTGGATWTSYTLDPARGLLYVPGGNPAPDFVKDVRGGDNLFTGSVVVLDARTGAYVRHFQLAPHDFHDWDVSSAPVLATTKAGRRLMAEAPKDGHLYGFDLTTGARLYRNPVTAILNADTPLGPQETRFCPGSQGGAEWNGAAFDPGHNLIFTGEVEWCDTVKIASAAKVAAAPMGQAWGGADTDNPLQAFGNPDPTSAWAGWMTATDADTGKVAWKFKAPTPLMGGTTPTAGGLLFFGDMAGTLYAFDAAKGAQLWAQKIGGAIGGGVITYQGAGGRQRVAVAAGMTSPIWPTEKTTAKVVVLGLE